MDTKDLLTGKVKFAEGRVANTESMTPDSIKPIEKKGVSSARLQDGRNKFQEFTQSLIERLSSIYKAAKGEVGKTITKLSSKFTKQGHDNETVVEL